MLGKEFVKTKGHRHLGKYGEAYIVLEGEAIYLMQKEDETVKDAYAVKSGKGDVIIIPPYYGHVTINPSKEKELKMANWVCNGCKSDYSPYEKKGGACYFYTEDGWIKNENYQNLPALRFEEPLESLPQDLNFLK
jgi:glucose-6-phosphate isomerase